MVFTLIQQGLGLRPRENRALCGKMGLYKIFQRFLSARASTLDVTVTSNVDPRTEKVNYS